MKHRASIVAALAVFLFVVPASYADSSAAPTGRSIKIRHTKVKNELATVAAGIEQAIKKNDANVAEKLYALEIRVSKLLTDATGAHFGQGGHGRSNAVSDIRATVRNVLRMQERLLEHTIEKLDRNLPGDPARKNWAREGVDLYRPLFRLSTPKPGQPKPNNRQVMNGMQNDFAEEGGSAKRIHYLGPKTIQKFKGNQLVEWVQVGSRVRVTDAGAKHPIIALEGKNAAGNPNSKPKSVRGAGSMKIYWGANGEIAMVVVSNSSGNYKPGIGSTIGVVQKLESLGIPSRRIVVTTVLPGEPVLLKLLLKADRLPKDQVKARVARVRNRVAKQVYGKSAVTEQLQAKARVKASRPKTTARRTRHQKVRKNARKRTRTRTASRVRAGR